MTTYLLSKQKFHLFVSMLFCFSFSIVSQGIKGTITDESGNPMPGASIFIAKSALGTTSNNDGYYEYNLPKGVHNIVIHALGYSRKELTVDINTQWIINDYQLKPINFSLGEVKIFSGKDPAYAIMRKAISRAPYHLQQAKNYEAEVYLKGSLNMIRMPKFIEKRIDVNGQKLKEGQTYTSESVNNIRFSAPDSFTHKVISSRSSFPGDKESAMLGYINSSFYNSSNNNLIISPLSPQAFSHYKFRYEGFFEDGDVTVNKIKVTPKRKSQQLVQGDLYIIEGTWNIHSLDFIHEPFWGKLRIRQMYRPVKWGVWLPINHQFNVDAAMMRIKANLTYSGLVKYLSVNINDEIIAKETIQQQPLEEQLTQKKEPQSKSSVKNQTKIEELLAKDDLSNRDMMKLSGLFEKENQQPAEKIELELKTTYRFDTKADTIKHDSLFWNNIRPTPLTKLERTSFAKNDSIQALRAAPDSIKTKSSKFKTIMSKSIMGATFGADSAKLKLQYSGLFDLKSIGFNAVDGWKYGQRLEFNWRQDSTHKANLALAGGYYFARQKAFGKLEWFQTFSPLKRGEFSISAFTGSQDYKTETALHPLLNMGASLFFKENYTRLFQSNNIKLKTALDITNGLRMKAATSFENNKPLQNNTNFSFIDKNELYHTNTINNAETNQSHFENQQAFIINLGWEYTPRHHYYIKKGQKVMAQSNFPTFTLNLEQGIKAFGTDADYLLAEIGASKQSEFSFRPTFDWAMNAGWFIRNKQMHFSSFKHFQASTIPILFNNPNQSLVLLNDYAPSTNQWFIKSHVTYSSPYLLLKNLPLISNSMWNENLSLSYLHTPTLPHYCQVGYSVSRIFMMGTIGAYAGFTEGTYSHWGIRAAFNLMK